MYGGRSWRCKIVIGESVPVLDAVARVTGQVEYLINLHQPQMLYGKIVFGTVPHADIVRVDTTQAELVPGAVAVLTGSNLDPRKPYGMGVKDRCAVAVDRVRYVGEPVAAIAAETLEAAEKAAALVQVEYRELPAVYDVLEAIAPGAPVLYDEHPVKPGTRTLLDLLRDDLGLVGAKEGCGIGMCGACTVLVDGKPMSGCITLAAQMQGRDIDTIEGIAPAKTGELHPVQKAFIEQAGFQCAFCTPGFILATVALLKENPSPTDEEIREYLAGNLCRCGSYKNILRAVKQVADKA